MSTSFVLYSYSKCSTCRDAVKWLRKHNVPFEERPIYDQPPTVEELKRMLDFHNGEVRRLFNTSGLEYKALHLKDKLPTLTTAEALQLLSSNGKLVKRPFLLGKRSGFVGFASDRWSEGILK